MSARRHKRRIRTTEEILAGSSTPKALSGCLTASLYFWPIKARKICIIQARRRTSTDPCAHITSDVAVSNQKNVPTAHLYCLRMLVRHTRASV